jgi:DNA-binding transcriptional LysR family regulator
MDLLRLKRRLRLRDLDTLASAVHFGGMHKAAEALHLSQPAVTKAIHELEDLLGVPLLERGRRGVEATSYGQALVRRSKAVFDELEGALREIEHLADPAAGEVHLGCMETLHAGLVGAAVERLTRKHPRMRFVLESGQSPDLIEHFLRERRVDFIVARPLHLPLPAEVDGEDLFCDQLLVAVGPQSPFAGRRRLTLADLADETWIVSRNELMREGPLGEAFAAAGLEMPRRHIVSGSLHTRYNLIETGRFVTLVPHSLLPFTAHRERLRILPIELPRWRTATMVLTLRGRTLAPAAELFLATLRELAQPLNEPLRAVGRARKTMRATGR